LKIGIYAPSKNEISHVSAWYESCHEADIIVVADTGSTDGTVEELISLGVQVTNVRIVPFRFDLAFNIAMSLLPEDIDVCIRLDLDERLQPGWRKIIEENWKSDTSRLRYTYIWNWNDNGTPGRMWYGDRIHKRNNFIWRGSTHEGLCSRSGEEKHVFCKELEIHHFPAAKDKKNDLSLLLEAVNETPTDARIKAYLGREYMYQNQYANATNTYKEFLTMSFDKVERQQAMCNLAITDSENKVYWLKLAAMETPGHREPLVNLAQHYYDIQNWQKCYEYALKALSITTHPMDYTCSQEAWSEKPHDLAAISAWNLKMYSEALIHARNAVSFNETDQRLQNNKNLIANFIDNELSDI